MTLYTVVATNADSGFNIIEYIEEESPQRAVANFFLVGTELEDQLDEGLYVAGVFEGRLTNLIDHIVAAGDELAREQH